VAGQVETVRGQRRNTVNLPLAVRSAIAAASSKGCSERLMPGPRRRLFVPQNCHLLGTPAYLVVAGTNSTYAANCFIACLRPRGMNRLVNRNQPLTSGDNGIGRRKRSPSSTT
jgi:hypothetical protein